MVFLDEPHSLEPIWRRLTRSSKGEQETWTDAYLAGFAIAAQARFVTFDRGFSRYGQLQITLLKRSTT
jgi:predicted nucleic acid-binding protein